jgi:predicted lipoprotein with Yx(FWY)xxD motif
MVTVHESEDRMAHFTLSSRQLGRLAAAGTTIALGGGVLAIGATPAVAATAHTAAKTVVTTTNNKTWGSILTLSNGDTVYRLTADSKNRSVCTGSCAKAWPPVLLASGQSKPSGNGVSDLGTITRSNGAKQVTYQGIPLYLYVGDKKADQVTGNLKDTWGQWWVVNPAHPTAKPVAKSSTTSSSVASSGGVAY